MGLKAVFLELKGVIIRDESIQQKLIADLLLQENLRSDPDDFQNCCLGRSDRDCLRDLLKLRGRVVSEDYLTKLISKKTTAYQQELNSLESLPIYDGLEEFLANLQQQNISIALVTGALQAEVQLILDKVNLSNYFQLIVAGEDITKSKPDPESFEVAMQNLGLQPNECLAIEDNYTGIAAAKQAGILVTAISHSYPLHMLQRRASFTVDYFQDIELPRIDKLLSGVNPSSESSSEII